MDWANIIISLLPLLPVGGAGQTTELATIAFKLIQQIKAQTGQTTQEILDHAGVTLEANKQKLLADLERLQGANP